MATRQYVQVQREALKESLRKACRENRLRPGDAAPSLRQLGEEFSLSQGVVVAALRELVEEGFLHTVERKGTFVGPPRPRERPLFVLINDAPLARYVQLRGGFEERIASLGGSVMTTTKEQARNLIRDNLFPDCAGVFELSLNVEKTLCELRENEGVEARRPVIGARLYFGEQVESDARDTVSFDDNSGGRLATEHLIASGHERIAFLGMHQDPRKCADGECAPDWSCWREHGWEKAMDDAGLARENLAFYAQSAWGFDCDLVQLENECVTNFLERFNRAFDSEKITAAVVVNDELAALVFKCLRSLGIASESWPAVVSFDGESQVQNDVVTSLRLPWEKLGRTAAEMLWERSHCIAMGAPIHRAVPMRLIPRLSCRTDWSALALAS